jgi:hypothetical protein
MCPKGFVQGLVRESTTLFGRKIRSESFESATRLDFVPSPGTLMIWDASNAFSSPRVETHAREKKS